MNVFLATVISLILSVNGYTTTYKDAPVNSDLCDSSVKSLSGYFKVESGNDKNYFFWLFESRSKPSTDPLIIWLVVYSSYSNKNLFDVYIQRLTGGPGCSSQLALMTENGPCQVTPDGLSTVNNPFSWNTKSNIMWIDQPAQVGFSYGTKYIDNDHNQTEVAEDMYYFLQG